MKTAAVVFAFAFLTMPVTAATLTWSGSVDSLWSNAANWVGGVPANGDDLLFTFGAANFRSVNDLPPGLLVHSITVAANAYKISGNAIVLDSGGISINNRFIVSLLSGSLEFSSITLNASQEWTSAQHAELMIIGPTNVNGKTLTITGGGTFSTHSLNGSGSIIENQTGDFANMFIQASFYSGSLTIDAGTLTLSGSAGSVQVNGGTYVPQNATTGSVTFGPGGTLHFAYPSITPASNVTGTITLHNATLWPNLGGPFTPGSTLTIFGNDGSDPVIGTFLGLPEGAIINSNGTSNRISYIGGNGNDVTVNVLASAAPATTTTLTSSLNPSAPGENVTLTAIVTSSSATPNGSVDFYDNGEFLGTSALSAGGQATLTVPLIAGQHLLTAAYTGSPSFAVSQATTLQFVFRPRRRALS